MWLDEVETDIPKIVTSVVNFNGTLELSHFPTSLSILLVSGI